MAFIKVNGVSIKGNSLPSHTWNADLVEFEGPLISLYKSERGEDVLYVWLDCTATRNRWAIVPLSRDSLQSYLRREISLRNVFERCSEIVVFDIGGGLRRSGFQITNWAAFPEQYRPKQNSFLIDEIATPDAQRLAGDATEDYFLGLDGNDLYIEDFTAIQKGFIQLYSFHYGLNYLDREAVQQKISHHAGQWTGGMSSVWIFDGLNSVIPSIHKPRIAELRFNSPGHIKLNLLPGLASEVEFSVQRVLDPDVFETTEVFYNRVYAYLKASGISGFDSERHQISRHITSEVSAALSGFVAEFLELMRWSARSRMLDELEGSPIAQLRLLFSYYRRLRKLRGYVVEGRLVVGQSRLNGN